MKYIHAINYNRLKRVYLCRNQQPCGHLELHYTITTCVAVCAVNLNAKKDFQRPTSSWRCGLYYNRESLQIVRSVAEKSEKIIVRSVAGNRISRYCSTKSALLLDSSCIDTPRTEVWEPQIIPLGSFINNFRLLSCLLCKYASGSNLCVCVVIHSNITALKQCMHRCFVSRENSPQQSVVAHAVMNY